jgi:hypothetical protein
MLALAGVVAVLGLLSPAPALGQTVVGTINSPAATVWYDMEVYEKGNVIFIADNTNAQILIYNATTLSYVGAISLSAYLPDTPQMTALHEGTGTLYVAVGMLSATWDTTLVIINADTYQIVDDIVDIGESVGLAVDESRARLYMFGGLALNKTLWALDINSNTIVGSLDVSDIMGSGIMAFSGERALNPVTGELFFANLRYDKFVVVNGPAMTGELISAYDSRGYAGTWNPQENKLYITTIDWNGYFIYDRDTGASTTASSINDGTSLFYSQATNRVYSGAEINGDTTVIEGDTNAWQDVEVAAGLAEVGFISATHHAYFASADQVKILNEDSLAVVSTIAGCEPDAYGTVDAQIVVSQQMGRVFIRNYWSNPSEGNCVLVIEEPLPVSQEDLLATWDGQGVYYRNSDTGAWVKLASPATMLTCGDLDEDGIDDLIGLWPTQGGIWVKYSKTGAWARLSSTAVHIAAGDMNGDGREDLLGTWDGQGVYYRDSESGAWVKMASPASMITTGDLNGDGTDDLMGIWPSQGGVWVKYSQSGAWARLSSTALDIAAGDMNGDGRDDLLATWDGQGVYYRNSMNGAWVKMATPADQVTCGDLDADGQADLIGIWPTQGGVWVKYSATGSWAKLSSSARDIAAGKMRAGTGGSMPAPALFGPMGGYAQGPESLIQYQDTSSEGPGGLHFVYQTEEQLIPQEHESEMMRIPGPGEPGFRCVEEKNLIPEESRESDATKEDRERNTK